MYQKKFRLQTNHCVIHWSFLVTAIPNQPQSEFLSHGYSTEDSESFKWPTNPDVEVCFGEIILKNHLIANRKQLVKTLNSIVTLFKNIGRFQV